MRGLSVEQAVSMRDVQQARLLHAPAEVSRALSAEGRGCGCVLQARRTLPD